MQKSKIKINYFSDVLCIWAYIAQTRMDEIARTYGENIEVTEHFIPVFGAVEQKMLDSWQNKGGITAYNQHVLEVAQSYSHIKVNPRIWLDNTPSSSANTHLFIKAVQILLDENQSMYPTKTLQQLIARLRSAFFVETKDVSALDEQMLIAEQLNLPSKDIKSIINSGKAMAALELDRELKEQHHLKGSPSILLNEGRQILYGNISYQVISANIQALLAES